MSQKGLKLIVGNDKKSATKILGENDDIANIYLKLNLTYH